VPQTEKPVCLRCGTVELIRLDEPGEMRFYECPECGRQFASREGGALVFRWRHPITLLLYPMIFEERPLERCESAAAEFAQRQPLEEIRAAIREVRLELDEPTQEVRETLGCRATEEELRAYLRCVAERLEISAGGRPGRPGSGRREAGSLS
jgi:hypothetical protein